MEELGELCHAHLKHEQGIRTTEDHRKAKWDAVGDIIIFLADYCNIEGINLQQALGSTWVDVQMRDWKQDPKGEKL
jgi:NTP pyrophosphatase (non-canonical NTP hydrolase)